MYPVPSGFCSRVNHGIANAHCAAIEDLLLAHDPKRERVHQRVAGVAIGESHLTGDGRNAKRVSVIAYAFHHAGHYGAVSRGCCSFFLGSVFADGERSKVQRVHRRKRPRAHREHVAQNSADAGGRALIRLDEGRVIVRFDFERGGESSSYVDHAGVFPRALKHAFAFGWQASQMHS